MKKRARKKIDLAKAAEGWEERLKVDEETKKAFADEKPVRVPVKYRYDAIHPEFLKMLAEIGAYANEKYGTWTLYLKARLEGDADPINHIYEHLREYRMRKPYDHFEGDVRRHLAAIAYNAMMAFVQESKWGVANEPWVDIPALLDLRAPAPTKPMTPEEFHKLTDSMMSQAAGAMMGTWLANRMQKALAKARKKKGKKNGSVHRNRNTSRHVSRRSSRSRGR